MGTTVLVVEDDLEINELLGEYLALENMRYLKATTGGAGVHLASAEHPDAVILDLMLPDVDGFEVARKLTGQRATFDVPVIILSCMCQEADREKGFASGALYYMNKPFLPDDLLATVRQALAWKAGLRSRVPAGELWLGGCGGEAMTCSKALQQMVADLFVRTDLDDAAVGQMREGIEMLNGWVVAWKAAHPGAGRVRVEYKVAEGGIAWTLSEEKPGMLADAFFKTAVKASGIGVGLMGWGGASKALAPVALPAAWMQLLTRTGAVRFEKDSQARTVRFVRALGKGQVVDGMGEGPVPVVEVGAVAGAVGAGERSMAPAVNGAK